MPPLAAEGIPTGPESMRPHRVSGILFRHVAHLRDPADRGGRCDPGGLRHRHRLACAQAFREQSREVAAIEVASSKISAARRYDSRAFPLTGSTSPGGSATRDRRPVRNTGPLLRPFSSRGSSRAVPICQMIQSTAEPLRVTFARGKVTDPALGPAGLLQHRAGHLERHLLG